MRPKVTVSSRKRMPEFDFKCERATYEIKDVYMEGDSVYATLVIVPPTKFVNLSLNITPEEAKFLEGDFLGNCSMGAKFTHHSLDDFSATGTYTWDDKARELP
jgi:hypothetical protein